MIKIIIIALISVFLSVIIKQKSPEFSLMTSYSGGVLILILAFEYLSEVVSFYVSIGDSVGIDVDILKLALKIVSIAVLTEFVSDIACDFGNGVIASKVVFCGRVVICLIMLPIIRNMVSLLFSFY